MSPSKVISSSLLLSLMLTLPAFSVIEGDRDRCGYQPGIINQSINLHLAYHHSAYDLPI